MAGTRQHIPDLEPRDHSPVFKPQTPYPTPPPTVLHVRIVAGSGGGPDKTILRSPAHVDPAQVRVAAAYIHPKGDPGIEVIREHAARFGSPLWTIAESGAVDLRTVSAMLRLCREQRVAIWHGHDYKSNLLGLMLRRLHPMRLVTTAHGWTHDTVRTRLYYRIDNRCLPRYEQVIAVSPKIYDHCLRIGVPADRLTYIPNAIDVDEFTPRGLRGRARAELNVPLDEFAIGVVGRLSVEKGVDRAIRAMKQIMTSEAIAPHLRLHLIGDGPQRDRLVQLAAQLGLADRVVFHGWQRDTRRFYEMMDLLLLPSHTEGFPNVVLEAMAMGVPAAATDVGGVRELLDDQRCGLILSQDETTWVPRLRELIAREEARTAFAQAAQRRVRQHYSFARRMQRVVRVYQRVCPVPPAAIDLRRAA